jgi:hypothetical protein
MIDICSKFAVSIWVNAEIEGGLKDGKNEEREEQTEEYRQSGDGYWSFQRRCEPSCMQIQDLKVLRIASAIRSAMTGTSYNSSARALPFLASSARREGSFTI